MTGGRVSGWASVVKVRSSLTEGPFPEGPEHLFLQVHADHFPLFPDHFRQGERKEPHRTAHIKSRHPRFHVGAQDFIGVLKQPPQGAGEEMTNPERANSCGQSIPPIFPSSSVIETEEQKTENHFLSQSRGGRREEKIPDRVSGFRALTSDS